MAYEKDVVISSFYRWEIWGPITWTGALERLHLNKELNLGQPGYTLSICQKEKPVFFFFEKYKTKSYTYESCPVQTTMVSG